MAYPITTSKTNKYNFGEPVVLLFNEDDLQNAIRELAKKHFHNFNWDTKPELDGDEQWEEAWDMAASDPRWSIWEKMITLKREAMACLNDAQWTLEHYDDPPYVDVADAHVVDYRYYITGDPVCKYVWQGMNFTCKDALLEYLMNNWHWSEQFALKQIDDIPLHTPARWLWEKGESPFSDGIPF